MAVRYTGERLPIMPMTGSSRSKGVVVFGHTFNMVDGALANAYASAGPRTALPAAQRMSG
jgi:hypothetical protein